MPRALRIVHTSDWHLGHVLKRQCREYEHRGFLDWLLDRLEELEADALLVAGDIFHTANPSAAARRMFYEFLATLRQRMPRLTPIIIGGNHDSAPQLDAPDAMHSAFGVRVVGGMSWTGDGHDVDRTLVPIARGDEVLAWVASIPFLRRSDLDPAILRDGGHADAVAAAYEGALSEARRRRQPGQALIAMGHGTMAGGKMSSDSERRIIRGGEEALPVEIFGDDVAYVALGHLHLAQSVGGLEHVRYCGSPIPLSMSEEGYDHQVLVADFEDGELARVEPVRVPRRVQMIRLHHSNPRSIDDTLAALEALTLQERPLQERPFLEVSVFLDHTEPNLAVKVRDALSEKPVRLIGIRTVRPESAGTCLGDAVQTEQLSDLAPGHVFQLAHERAYGAAPDEDLRRAFAELEQRAHGAY